jgi:hypothetical protein
LIRATNASPSRLRTILDPGISRGHHSEGEYGGGTVSGTRVTEGREADPAEGAAQGRSQILLDGAPQGQLGSSDAAINEKRKLAAIAPDDFAREGDADALLSSDRSSRRAD